ncbi:hypothetical protein [Streptomyces sp. NPDC088350]|uniref:hypothetical protein n=1 Tax=Streptomyces sp. NPDC088350 TaxID=3365854 RepID=UPI00380F1E18
MERAPRTGSELPDFCSRRRASPALARAVGPSRAAELGLRGDRFGAEGAWRWGLAHRGV